MTDPSKEQTPAIREAPASDPATHRLPAAIDMESSTVGEAATTLESFLTYASNLRDRTVKSASALAGGIRESPSWLVPSAFRNARSYRIFLAQMLESVTVDLEGVRRAFTAPRVINAQHQALARRTVANLFDMTALATFHLSPIVVLAIFGDIAYSNKKYLRQLSDRLKKMGITTADATLDNSEQLLQAIERAAVDATAVFKSPPLVAEDLRRTIASIERAVASQSAEAILPLRDVDQLWRQMELAAEQQNASLWDISATIAVVVLNQIALAKPASSTELEIPADLFSHKIMDFYWLGLRHIERQGLIPTISTASEPYLDSIWKNFSMDRKTWAEQLIGGELLKWGWSQLSWPKLHRN